MPRATRSALTPGILALGLALGAAPAAMTATPAHPATTHKSYRVKAGDTMSRIAKAHKTTVKAIAAYLVGDPKATRTQMVLGNMHGDEPRTDDTAYAIINGPKVKGVKIWVIRQKNLSHQLGLPIKWTGSSKKVSPGTLVGHVNAAVKPTAAITVEFSASPSKAFTDVKARNGVVKAVGGSY